MKSTRGYLGESVRPYPVATIGNFDGHHVGHHALLQMVVQRARQTHGTALVLTFDPHPVKILAPHIAFRFLTSSKEKVERFEAAGIDEVVQLEFSETFAALSPKSFVEQVLCHGLGIKEIFVGQHFVFGHKRTGTVEDLVRLCSHYGVSVHPLPPVMLNGAVVSSTRIRKLIQAGNVGQAATLLGRHYSVMGVVSQGVQRGRTLGWPTANVRLAPDRMAPPDGVYATKTVLDRQRYDSVTYIGTRPTFDAGERLMEVYLLDGAQDFYGQSILVEFIEHLRDDIKFKEGDALSRQIKLDVALAKTMLRGPQETIGK